MIWKTLSTQHIEFWANISFHNICSIDIFLSRMFMHVEQFYCTLRQQFYFRLWQFFCTLRPQFFWVFYNNFTLIFSQFSTWLVYNTLSTAPNMFRRDISPGMISNSNMMSTASAPLLLLMFSLQNILFNIKLWEISKATFPYIDFIWIEK